RLERASMEGADLEGTWMVHTCLKGAHLTGASLKDAYLRKADLREVGGLEIDQLLDARIYSATRLPSRLASDQRIEALITECEAIQGLPTLLTGEWAPEPLPDRP
ncbi:pentapeptide repeat-containing protein, partial [Streptomyces sp. TRM76130]|nr:pentapeptide repeat-containing protein [Streptomyces sp. TRM76130]